MQGGPFSPLRIESATYQARSGGWQVTTLSVGSGLAQAVNSLYYQPRSTSGGRLDRIAVQVGSAVASSAQRFGIYLPATDGRPGALLADLGTVATTGTGLASLTVSVDLPPGMVYFATVSQGGASGATVSSAANSTQGFAASSHYNSSTTNLFDAEVVGFIQTGVTGALPATATPADHGGTYPKIGWRWA